MEGPKRDLYQTRYQHTGAQNRSHSGIPRKGLFSHETLCRVSWRRVRYGVHLWSSTWTGGLEIGVRFRPQIRPQKRSQNRVYFVPLFIRGEIGLFWTSDPIPDSYCFHHFVPMISPLGTKPILEVLDGHSKGLYRESPFKPPNGYPYGLNMAKRVSEWLRPAQDGSEVESTI